MEVSNTTCRSAMINDFINFQHIKIWSVCLLSVCHHSQFPVILSWHTADGMWVCLNVCVCVLVWLWQVNPACSPVALAGNKCGLRLRALLRLASPYDFFFCACVSFGLHMAHSDSSLWIRLLLIASPSDSHLLSLKSSFPLLSSVPPYPFSTIKKWKQNLIYSWSVRS